MKNNRGFTLVELIIVVAVIAVLASVLAPQYLRYVERARESNDLQVATNLVRASTVVAADPKFDIPAGSYFVVRWDTSDDPYGAGSMAGVTVPNTGGGRISVEFRGGSSSAPPVSNDELDVIEEQLLSIMGAAVGESIGEAESVLANSHDLLFRVNTSTGVVEVHRSYAFWVEDLGLPIGIANF